VRFLSQGEALLDNSLVEHILSSVVESVLIRLEEQGVADTALEKEWAEVRQADKDVEEFCLAAARLGLDPYSEAIEIESQILRAAQELSGNVFEDFLDAVNPWRISAALDWISDAGRSIRESAKRIDGAIARLMGKTAGRGNIRSTRPWELGWRQATEVRMLLRIPSEEVFEIDDFLESRIQGADHWGLQAVGGTIRDGMPVVVLGREQARTTKRFTLARALWHVLYEDDPLFLITSAYTDRQKIERAFAAELLAPAQGVAERLEGALDVVVSEDLEQVARHFRVSPTVIHHQVENQLSASIVG
jgi:Zn-dependent peptidase ImmA (M78 family)